MREHRSLLLHVAVLLLLVAILVFVLVRSNGSQVSVVVPAATTTVQTATTTIPTTVASTTATTTVATTSVGVKNNATSTPKAKKASIKAAESPAIAAAPSSPNDITRIDNPYSTPPSSFETVNATVRPALVNILCQTQTGGGLIPISGSGVLLGSKGVVLTNAHVAQYVLIAQTERSDLTCTVRSGGPAVAKWKPVVLYIPPVWIEQHAADIVKSHPLGTGEHDYALLYLAATIDGSPLPASFPGLSPDTREAIGFIDDNVLVASYPVEFMGGNVISANLYPASSITTVKQLLTFSVGKADVLSLGGVIEAQSGSSGGTVVNAWNRAIGLVTTTSEGATTAERDLHAITTGYIDRDMKAQSGHGLLEMLSSDPYSAAQAFKPIAGALADKLLSVIAGR